MAKSEGSKSTKNSVKAKGRPAKNKKVVLAKKSNLKTAEPKAGRGRPKMSEAEKEIFKQQIAQGLKKQPGRPSLNSEKKTQVKTAEPKAGRGRPKMSEAEKELFKQQVAKGLKKSPGRPKLGTATQPKKERVKDGRGRPKMSEADKELFKQQIALGLKKSPGRPKLGTATQPKKERVKDGRGRPKMSEADKALFKQQIALGLKKSPGRPKLGTATQPKKERVKDGRGRPKMSEAEKELFKQQIAQGLKKRPGRPSLSPDKKKQVVSNEPKKGRGRPRLATSATQPKKERVKDGRGRPKMSEADKALFKQQIALGLKKSPGRPKLGTVAQPKKARVKDGRGRPKMSEAEKEIFRQQIAQGLKKRPGRPSLNADKKEKAVSTEPKKGRGRPKLINAGNTSSSIVVGVKKGRGRPKLGTTVSQTKKEKVKDGRGRPKMSDAEKELFRQQVAMGLRKRPGRPSLNSEKKTQVISNEPKKGRGRPRLNPLQNGNSSNYSTNENKNQTKSNFSPSYSNVGIFNNSAKRVTMQYGGKKVDIDLVSKFDFSGYSKDTILKWYKLNHLGRKLDEKAALYLKMAKGWSYHAPFAGHDGIQLALGQVFRANKDFLFPYYRDFLTSLSGGLTPEEIILNGLSKETDVAGGGRHMSNHFAKPSINVENVSSCTGNHSLHASGVGRAIRKYNGDEIVFYSGGESACAEGYFYEAISAADLDKAPVVFVIQNNQFGISVPLHDVSSTAIVSDNFRGFTNLKIINVDGLDPFACHRALLEAITWAKNGNGPAMVHAMCDRIGSHSNSDRHELYRTEEVLAATYRRDPLMQFRYHILNNKYISESALLLIEEENKQSIFAAADKAEAAPAANGNSWNQFLVPPSFVNINDNTEKPLNPNAPTINLIEGINQTLKEEFRRNPNTFLWGQDIGKGGVFNVVKGMPQEFGKARVFNAAIAEDMIVGTANGFSRYRDDIRLVIEGSEFADYFWPAMEQLVELSHEYWRTKGQNIPNITIRIASGGYIQGGIYHSQNLEGTFATLPGLRIVQPAFADDAVGLLRNCIRSQGVTLFLEPKYLYNFKPASGPTPPDDFIIPFGKAKIRRSGEHVTIVTYGTGVHLSSFAAEELAKQGISVEIIDLRSIAPWDRQTVVESVRKTNRVIVAHEDKLTGGFGGEIASVISELCFNFLDAPVVRVGSKDSPVGFAKSYEDAILLSINDIKEAVLKVYNY